MNPFWFVAKVAGVAVFTAAASAIVLKKLAPGPSDLLAGAIHFRNSLAEFQKGVSAVLFGAGDATGKQKEEKRESSRIPID